MLRRQADQVHDFFNMKDSEHVFGKDNDRSRTVLIAQGPAQTTDASVGELTAFGHLLEADQVIFVKGKVDQKRERPNILTDELIGLDEVRDKLAARVAIKLEAREVTEEKVMEIRNLCEHHRGKSSLLVSIHTDQGRVYANADQRLNINPSVEFCKQMKQLVGEENVVLTK